MTRRPHVLISNDDGVNAPGLVALAACLREENFCDFSICGPSGERSGQSHSINIHRALHAFPIPPLGAKEAWAVDGTPADAVMLALYGPILQNAKNLLLVASSVSERLSSLFWSHYPRQISIQQNPQIPTKSPQDNAVDLVVSGINRGDNLGLHVIYSGTVGAAREAACKGVPALAFSLDSHVARSVEAFEEAARHSARLIRAVLGLAPAGQAPPAGPPIARLLPGKLLNINLPLAAPRGYCLARQGVHCARPRFEDTTVLDTAVSEAAAVSGGEHAHGLRAFNNLIGETQVDDAEGTDSWAVRRGWIAVCPIGLASDVPATAAAAVARTDPALLDALRRGLAQLAEAERLEVLIADTRE